MKRLFFLSLLQNAALFGMTLGPIPTQGVAGSLEIRAIEGILTLICREQDETEKENYTKLVKKLVAQELTNNTTCPLIWALAAHYYPTNAFVYAKKFVELMKNENNLRDRATTVTLHRKAKSEAAFNSSMAELCSGSYLYKSLDPNKISTITAEQQFKAFYSQVIENAFNIYRNHQRETF